jgi:putative transposase
VPIEDPLPPGLPPARSLRRWRAKYRAAQVACGCGFTGLLPDRRSQGNRNPKLPESSINIMAEFIENDFETIKNKSASAVHGALAAACDERGVVTPSLKTFLLAVKTRPQYEQLLKREGRRKAYSREPFYLELELTTQRHGDRPFEIAHIDHTELDVELVCSRTGRNLGRLWLTLLVDAFSRRILAVYVTFDAPSYSKLHDGVAHLRAAPRPTAADHRHRWGKGVANLIWPAPSFIGKTRIKRAESGHSPLNGWPTS